MKIAQASEMMNSWKIVSCSGLTNLDDTDDT